MKLFGMIYHQFIDNDTVKGGSFQDHIPYYNLWKKLGARFHRDNVRDCLVFRFATFTISSSGTVPLSSRLLLKLSIPFIHNDIGIGIFHGRD